MYNSEHHLLSVNKNTTTVARSSS